MLSKHAGILIVGSLNMDLVVKVGNLPKLGETVAGSDFKMLPGGKGANQAYAVGRLIAGRDQSIIPRVQLVGCVGRDVYGEQLRASLQAAGVDLTYIRAIEGASGVALITVEEGGQNQIIVAGGANHALRPDEVREAIATSDAGYLLLQLESPMEVVKAAAAAGQARAMTVILDPAPACPLPTSLLANIDVLTPNESEALALLETAGTDIRLSDAPDIARRLLALGPRCVILKLGEKGVWVAEAARSKHFPARQVKAIDVTAAGDCFNGAFAVGLAEGMAFDQAIAFATSAAAITVTRFGAQSSIPERAEVDELLRLNGHSKFSLREER